MESHNGTWDLPGFGLRLSSPARHKNTYQVYFVAMSILGGEGGGSAKPSECSRLQNSRMGAGRWALVEFIQKIL